MNERDARLDLIRVFAALAVVWLHVSANVVAAVPDAYDTGWWAGNVADAFSRWCVPVFVMLGGYLALSSPTAPEPGVFYRRRLARLLPALGFWSLLYLSLRWLREDGFGAAAAVRSVLQGEPYFHLWYLYMTLGLVVFTPWLRRAVTGLEANGRTWLIVSCFAVASAESLAGGQSATFLPRFLSFTGYFLAGHHLLSTPTKAGRWARPAVILGCGAAIAVSSGMLLPRLGPDAWGLMYDYLNPLVILMSLAVFVRLSGSDTSATALPAWKKWLTELAPITLGIYCLHPLWLLVLGRAGIDGFMGHPVVGIPVTTLLAFVLSAGVCTVMARIPLLRPVVC